MPDGNNYTIEPVDDPFIDDGGGGGDDDTGGDSGSDVDDGGSPGANDSRMSEPVEPITRPPTDDINDGGETGANDSLQSEPPSNDGGDVSFSTGGDDDTGGGTVDDGGQIGVNEDPISKPSQQTDPEPGTAADERLEANRLTEPPGQDAPTNEKVERIVNSRKRLEQARENIRRQAGPASSPKAVQAQPEDRFNVGGQGIDTPAEKAVIFGTDVIQAGQDLNEFIEQKSTRNTGAPVFADTTITPAEFVSNTGNIAGEIGCSTRYVRDVLKEVKLDNNNLQVNV